MTSTTYTVIERSSVDTGDRGTVRGEFDSREAAEAYIRENTVDGLNVSEGQDCNYLMIDGDED